MKKILIISAITLVIVGGLVHVFTSNKRRHQQNTPSSQTTSTIKQQPAPTPKIETVTVTYTDEGFSPQRIEVAKGSTVNFVNKSSMPIWVASDPHPEHTDYPEFDTPRVLGRMPQMGEDFSFTFEKVGTWKYHSHTASGDGTEVGVHPGVIIVK